MWLSRTLHSTSKHITCLYLSVMNVFVVGDPLWLCLRPTVPLWGCFETSLHLKHYVKYLHQFQGKKKKRKQLEESRKLIYMQVFSSSPLPFYSPPTKNEMSFIKTRVSLLGFKFSTKTIENSAYTLPSCFYWKVVPCSSLQKWRLVYLDHIRQ